MTKLLTLATTQLTFLGLELNKTSQTVSVPQDKILQVSNKLSEALCSDKIKLKNLQSLIGSLSFVCHTVSSRRAFLHRLINLNKGIQKPWHSVRLSKGAKENMHM